MPSRRRLLATVGSLAVATVAGCSDAPDQSSPTATATPTSTTEAPATADTATQSTTGPTETVDSSPTPGGAFSLSSPSFEDGGPIPETFTCDGQNVSPALDVAEPPTGAETFALVADDPDAPREDPFVHWLLWNVPGDVRRIPVNVSQTETVERLGDARQGTTDAGSLGYTGPCPPAGDGAHRYRFTLYALDAPLAVEAGATRDRLDGPLAEHRLDATTLTGTYARQRSQYRVGRPPRPET